MNLAPAERYGERIKAAILSEFHPLKMEVAGSVRRRRPECGDLDFVILPAAPGDVALIEARFRVNCRAKEEGKQNARYLDRSGFQLDVYFARAETRDFFSVTAGNWGTLLICRTGSMAFNAWLATAADSMNFHWNPYSGLLGRDGGVIASEEEADIFKALGLAWIPPEERER
jgi:DNA polymerase (family 10)